MKERMAPLLSCLSFAVLMNIIMEVTSQCVDVNNCSCTVDNFNIVIADCSRRNLLFVPKFQPNVTIINLSSNNISTLSPNNHMKNKGRLDLLHKHATNRGSFSSLTQVKSLDLSNNSLQYTPEVYYSGVFDGLVSLEILNIKHNNKYITDRANLSYPESLSELVSMSKLKLDGLDASNVRRTLPRMSALKTLDFSGTDGMCNLKIIPSQFLNNVPHLVHVNFAACHLEHIENGTFNSLNRLENLNISFNDQLTFAVLPNVTHDLQFTNIKIMDISGIHCLYGVGTFLFVSDIIRLQNTSLETFVCDSNRLVQVEDQFMYNLPSTLKNLYVRDNKLTFGMYVLEFGGLNSMLKLDASRQYTSHSFTKQRRLFHDCNDWRGPPRKHSLKNEKLSIQSNALYSNISNLYQNEHTRLQVILHLPPNMEEIVFENADLVYEIPPLKVAVNNSVQILKFGGNFLHSWTGPVANMHDLRYLDLSNNLCSSVSTSFFDSAPQLQTLLLSNNYLGFVLIKDIEGRTFECLPKLATMDMSSNRIDELGPLILKNQTNMVSLNLSSNLLREFNVNIGHMKHLQYLDLSSNQLPYLTRNSMLEINSLLARTNFTIDMWNNPLQCSCERLEFLRWMMTNKHMFSRFEHYKCTLNNGTKVLFCNLGTSLIEMERDCASYVVLILCAVAAIVLSVSVVIGGLVYRYRWKLRYVYYMTKNKFVLNDHVRNCQDRLVYTYDAFISHAEEDSDFVTGDLLRNMEEINQLNICLHQRDFIPGRDIAGNVTNAVHNSRRTVAILSPDFLRSEWCMFEFNMARMEGIYSRESTNVLFLVFYRSVRPKELPLTLMELIDTESYLEYPGDPQGNAVFWDKMAQALT